MTTTAAQHLRVHQGAFGVALAAYQAGDAVDDSRLQPAEKTKAFLTVFNTIAELTRGPLAGVQADAERLWGGLSSRSKRDVAANPGAAPAIVAEAMRSDTGLATKLPLPGQLPASMAAGAPEKKDLIRLAELAVAADASEAGRSSGARFAALRSANEAREAEARQFAGLGLGSAAVSAFSAVGMDRAQFDLYRKQGFSAAHIAETAKDAQALGFKGREDVDVAMRASSDLREAAAAVAKAKTPEQKAAAQKRYDDAVKRNDERPDSDPRKKDNKRFIQRVNDRAADKRLEIGSAAARSQSDKDIAVSGTKSAVVARMATGKAAALAAVADASESADAFGVDLADAKADKTEPVKTASVEKPAAKEAVRKTKPVSGEPAVEQKKPDAKPVQIAAAKSPSPTV